MKKILFPTDFSESSNNALAFAGKFASDNNASLVLYNANRLLEPITLEDVNDKLNDVAREVRDFFKIQCSTIVQPGGLVLSNMVGKESAGYDLVIMGTNGADDLTQFLNGSNAFNIILKSKVPVLVIPIEFKGEQINSVVYAFDASRSRVLPVRQLMPWLKAIRMDTVRVIQVVENASAGVAREALAITEPVADGVVFTFESIPSSSDVALDIHQHMIRIDSGALCLCTQRRTFIEDLFHRSTIKGITAMASYPLFIFHE